MIQAFINMAVTVNLFPVTGVTLPLVSMGGSSFLFTCLAIGIILSVARNVEQLEAPKAEAASKASGAKEKEAPADKDENTALKAIGEIKNKKERKEEEGKEKPLKKEASLKKVNTEDKEEKSKPPKKMFNE